MIFVSVLTNVNSCSAVLVLLGWLCIFFFKALALLLNAALGKLTAEANLDCDQYGPLESLCKVAQPLNSFNYFRSNVGKEKVTFL